MHHTSLQLVIVLLIDTQKIKLSCAQRNVEDLKPNYRYEHSVFCTYLTDTDCFLHSIRLNSLSLNHFPLLQRENKTEIVNQNFELV